MSPEAEQRMVRQILLAYGLPEELEPHIPNLSMLMQIDITHSLYIDPESAMHVAAAAAEALTADGAALVRSQRSQGMPSHGKGRCERSLARTAPCGPGGSDSDGRPQRRPRSSGPVDASRGTQGPGAGKREQSPDPQAFPGQACTHEAPGHDRTTASRA